MERRILFVTEAAFHPPYQGDAARVAAFVTHFRSIGWYVAVCHQHDATQLDVDYLAMGERCHSLSVFYPTADELAARGEGGLDGWCPERFASLVASTCENQRIAVVVVQCAFLSRCFNALPNQPILKIVDADNIFANRARLYSSAGLPYLWATASAGEECAALRRADLVLAIQNRELYYYKHTYELPNLLLVPHGQPFHDIQPAAGKNLLFVGADNPENLAGQMKFIECALPRILARYPDARLRVAGRIAQRLPDHPAIDRLGVVADLSLCYQRTAIVLNTTPVGTGLKIKSVDALCHAACLVSTPAGVEGLEDDAKAFHVASTPDEFSECVIRLLGNPEELAQSREHAKQFAINHFDPEKVFRNLSNVLESWVAFNNRLRA